MEYGSRDELMNDGAHLGDVVPHLGDVVPHAEAVEMVEVVLEQQKPVAIEAASTLSVEALSRGFETCNRQIDEAKDAYVRKMREIQREARVVTKEFKETVANATRDVQVHLDALDEDIEKQIASMERHAELRKDWIDGQRNDLIGAVERAALLAKHAGDLHVATAEALQVPR